MNLNKFLRFIVPFILVLVCISIQADQNESEQNLTEAGESIEEILDETEIDEPDGSEQEEAEQDSDDEEEFPEVEEDSEADKEQDVTEEPDAPEEEIADEVVLDYLDESSVVVSSQSELSAALKNAKIGRIIFGADIVLTSRIEVVPERAGTELIIDGDNYQLTEMNTDIGTHGRNIYMVGAGTLKKITLRNMRIRGYNYYGTYQISDAASKEMTMFYDGITYYGPQITYAVGSHAIYKDSFFYLDRVSGLPGEVCEANRVSLEGNILIDKTRFADDNEIFYIRSTSGLTEGGITVKSGAHVEIYNATTTGGSGLYHSAESFVIEESAYFYYEGYGRIGDSGKLLSKFEVGSSAKAYFNIKGQTDGGEISVPIYTKNFVVKEDAILHITAVDNKNSDYGLVWITEKGVFQNPRSVLLWNKRVSSNANVIGGVGKITVTTGEIRHWKESVSPISDVHKGSVLEYPGTYHWYNENGSDFTVDNGMFSNYTGSGATSTYSTRNVNGIAYNSLYGIEYKAGVADGGTPPVEEQGPFRSETSVTVLANSGELYKKGHRFGGWNISGSEDTVQPGDNIYVSDNLVLIPVFEKLSYQVTTVYVDRNSNALEVQPVNNIHIVPGGDGFRVVPEKIENYKEQFYMVDGDDMRYEFSQEYIITEEQTIYVYYADTVINITMPENLLFTAYPETKGKIISPRLTIKNNSDLPIDIDVTKLETKEEHEKLTLVEAAKDNGEYHLGIEYDREADNNGFDNDIKNIRPDITQELRIGSLNGYFNTSEERPDTGMFRLGGKYKGPFYPEAMKTKILFTFHIELKEGID